MKNQIEIVKDIADSMDGIGGIPTNKEFYAEFDMRVKEALNIEEEGEEKRVYDLKMLLVELRHIYLFNIDVEKNLIIAPMSQIISIWERVHQALHQGAPKDNFKFGSNNKQNKFKERSKE